MSSVVRIDDRETKVVQVSSEHLGSNVAYANLSVVNQTGAPLSFVLSESAGRTVAAISTEDPLPPGMGQAPDHLVITHGPLAPFPEPTLTLHFGGLSCEVGVTYLHHLINCGGWRDRESSYFSDDCQFARWLDRVEQVMLERGAENYRRLERHHQREQRP
jgi:hypothetical protein